jgi:8-oxo-dGTP pyrophosphatase MutT (NUDIX family)
VSIDPEDLRRRLVGTGRERGDHDLNPGMQPSDRMRAAAVLVPLVERAEGVTILLTRRTEHLQHHAGQISFPGGRIETVDASPEHAALRETEEEIGLCRRHIELLGRLDRYRTRTGFDITPVVGWVKPPFDLAPDRSEVAEVFEVPLDFVTDPRNHERHSREWQGVRRHFYVLPYGGYYIWGATAGMLVNLAERVRR